MTSEANMSSVLAKLMNIDKPPISHSTCRGHRVLSENYLQNIASVTKREKVFPLSDDSDFEMYVSEDFLCRTRNSIHARRSISSSSSVDQKRRNSLKGRHNGMNLQEKRLSSSIGSPIRSSVSSQEIAKQVTGQVKHSLWHSCAELSSSRSTSKRSSENIEENTTTLFTHSFDSRKKQDASSFTPAKVLTSMETKKTEKQLSERWRMRKCSEEVRMPPGRKIQDEVSVRCPVFGTRYLSKPAIFPYTWVPRSKARHFTLDKKWSLRPGKMVSKQCITSKEFKEVQPTYESCICLVKPCSHQEASLIFNDSVNLVKENSCEETFTLSGSLINKSDYSDVGNPSIHENEASQLEKDDSRENAIESLFSNCDFACPSLETDEVTDEGNENMTISVKFRKENLSGDEESFKYQLKHKTNACEPRSPVSSLEGPEDCSHTLNLIVEEAEHLSVLECLENDAQGLHKKLHLIETISLESGSEGPEMVVSSDEDDDENSVGLYQNNPQFLEIYQTFVKDCWDFSYLIDVVAESGLQMRNLVSESNILQDYVINPSVFDSLEKKYGKSMPWEKSERRLLFDRLSSGLLDIVRPLVGLNHWRHPVAKRFRPMDRSLELEEELWSMLVKQQQELKRDSSDKVCRKEIEWLDLEEDTNLIAEEIESLLLDEMVDEFVSLEISFS